uniref:Uncharacterized protein n=1 Tax=viral metagenome TaxID=1070528 RepID=A0A6C0APA5_9ZZZZ
MEISLTNFLIGTLAITISIYIFRVTRESFNSAAPVSDETRAQVANAHTAAPALDPKVVESAKTGIKNMITERPDVILAIKQVIADPLIKKTLGDILYSVRR